MGQTTLIRLDKKERRKLREDVQKLWKEADGSIGCLHPDDWDEMEREYAQARDRLLSLIDAASEQELSFTLKKHRCRRK